MCGSDLKSVCAHVLGGALFVQLILLWSSSWSGTRGLTVVPASLSFPLCPPLRTSPVSSPYAKIQLPLLRDLPPAVTFLISMQVRARVPQ